MVLARRKKSRIPERLDPGDPEPEPCSPGSIEQQLDMCEDGDLRGDNIIHLHGNDGNEETPEQTLSADQLVDRLEVNMSEPNREGDEMSGDEHSAGLQGGDPDLERQPHIDSGLPGEETEDEAAKTVKRERD